jgi:hypothetical protein
LRDVGLKVTEFALRAARTHPATAIVEAAGFCERATVWLARVCDAGADVVEAD